MDIEINENNRWRDLKNIFERDTQFKGPNFAPSEELTNCYLEQAKVLVIGAGGLGCEILKNLALSGVKDIHVIDLDTIDLTNLNRQFLFRQDDVGKFKSEVAAKFIMNRVPGCKVTAHVGRIEQKTDSFYKEFQIIISGLDNVGARRWLNSLVHGLCEFDDNNQPIPENQILLIDGGTEGFKGQARVIKPFQTACYECTLGTLPNQETYNICTIANTPRTPAHCVAYAYLIEWKKQFPDKKLDKDSIEDMQWVFQTALQRAQQFNIEGVDYMMTMGVVKNIIPAIASTNAIIAAACVNEAVKAITDCSYVVQDYFQYMGNEGYLLIFFLILNYFFRLHTLTFKYEKNPNCFICSNTPIKIKISKNMLLKDFQKLLQSKPYEFLDPSLTGQDGRLIIPVVMRDLHKEKLEMTFDQLAQQNIYKEGEIIYITDQKIHSVAKVIVSFDD
ncbi:nedd8 activating enzyme, putative [Ichthyophthirius multifiliis]|uniref:NEDD8-activating enzyme E1 catalytic subunit n=1 Tax=Ichthyophthirius multifiliis TaxID=5932 RepID=G0QY73_ICHMU|nr:nedd8 activating enzyme, putative [Ichthyophthirius multifiliis]EGR29812.1 nedd8 activating enzyme, putative [Ichthyophthirius multifiliis]|eukprot:XP_004031048.1 nedd8 activating enzyme, putative [Ichthyophthirius multifiliis]